MRLRWQARIFVKTLFLCSSGQYSIVRWITRQPYRCLDNCSTFAATSSMMNFIWFMRLTASSMSPWSAADLEKVLTIWIAFWITWLPLGSKMKGMTSSMSCSSVMILQTDTWSNTSNAFWITRHLLQVKRRREEGGRDLVKSQCQLKKKENIKPVQCSPMHIQSHVNYTRCKNSGHQFFSHLSRSNFEQSLQHKVTKGIWPQVTKWPKGCLESEPFLGLLAVLESPLYETWSAFISLCYLCDKTFDCAFSGCHVSINQEQTKAELLLISEMIEYLPSMSNKVADGFFLA